MNLSLKLTVKDIIITVQSWYIYSLPDFKQSASTNSYLQNNPLTMLPQLLKYGHGGINYVHSHKCH